MRVNRSEDHERSVFIHSLALVYTLGPRLRETDHLGRLQYVSKDGPRSRSRDSLILEASEVARGITASKRNNNS